MKTRHALVFDFGTSSLKAGLVSLSGELSGYQRIVYEYPAGYTHWTTDIWISALCKAVERIHSSCEGEWGTIEAIAVSGNGPTLVPLDRQGRQQGPVLFWHNQEQKLDSSSLSFYLPKVLWYRSQKLWDLKQISYFLSFPEYIYHVLGDTAVTISPGENFSKYIWTTEDLCSAGLNPEQFAPYVEPGSRIGSLNPSWAVKFGLPSGLPLIAAGSDFMMALLGTDTMEPGKTCDRAGSSEGINYCSSVHLVSSELRVLPHLVSGLYNIAGILDSSGLIFDWFRRFSGQEQKPYAAMLREIHEIRHHALEPCFYPSLQSGNYRRFSGGAFTGLEFTHGAAEMGRGVIRAIGFTLAYLLASMQKAGCSIGSIVSTGGQARNDLWNQMKADMTGFPIQIPHILDAELAGCAACAFTGLGFFSDLRAASGALVKISAQYTPDPEENEKYAKEGELYRQHRQQVFYQNKGE